LILIIAVPNRDDISGATARSLVRITREAAQCGVEAYMVSANYTYLDLTRNKIVEGLNQYDWDYCLMVDSDISITNSNSENIFKRWKESGKDFIAGIYANRKPPHLPHIFALSADKKAYNPLIVWPENDMFPVDAAATGFMLFTKSALSKIKNPKPFNYTNYGHPTSQLGEDLSFCKKMKNAGVQLWADPFVKLGHQSSIIYTIDDFKMMREEMFGNVIEDDVKHE
jgi:hypothetical protein